MAGWSSWWELEPFALLASQLGTVTLELAWAGVREAPQGKPVPTWVWSLVCW